MFCFVVIFRLISHLGLVSNSNPKCATLSRLDCVLLEDILHQEACDHAHGRWQASGAHALPLQGLLVNVGCHHQRRSTLRGGEINDTAAIALVPHGENLTQRGPTAKHAVSPGTMSWMCPDTAFSLTPDSIQV